MYIKLSEIEKILSEKELCTPTQFRLRCVDKKWKPNCYLTCYKAVLDHCGITVSKGGEKKALWKFLNRALEEGPDPGINRGPKRRHVDFSYAESSDEGDVHDISLSSAMSIDRPDELLDLQRVNAQLRRDLKGNFIFGSF